MLIAGVRFKKRLGAKIKDTQKIYRFVCPIKDIKKGEYVLVETTNKKRGNSFAFNVGVVVTIEQTEARYIDFMNDDKLPVRMVISRFNVDDFDKRCKFAKDIKERLISIRQERYKKRTAKRLPEKKIIETEKVVSSKDYNPDPNFKKNKNLIKVSEKIYIEIDKKRNKISKNK